jgi:predicted transposase/invertase (TIGR01784 family)
MREKTYDELEFTDDFLFCHILMENEDLCIELVEMITGRKIKSIVKPESQKSIRLTYDGKGVRFDVYFEDEENVIYDIEMQASKKHNLRKRARYYQGMIDLDILGKGKDYSKLKEEYIIFICTFDEFGDGRHIYSFENVCKENPDIKLDDGTHKIFLCAGGNNDDCSEKMKDFLDYIVSKKTNGKLSKRLQNEVEKSKKHEEWRTDYMTLLEKYEEKIEEGRELGRQEERQNTEAERKRADKEKSRADAAESELERYKAKYGKL